MGGVRSQLGSKFTFFLKVHPKYGWRYKLSNTLVLRSFKIGSTKKTVFATKQIQKNDLGLIFGVPGSKWRCASFWFRRDFRVCKDLATARIYWFLLIQNELCQDRFGWWAAFQSTSWYYKWFLIYPHVKTGTKLNAGLNGHLFQYCNKISIYY